MAIEDIHQNLKKDLAQLLLHWHKLAEHKRQGDLPRRVIRDCIKELQAVTEKY